MVKLHYCLTIWNFNEALLSTINFKLTFISLFITFKLLENFYLLNINVVSEKSMLGKFLTLVCMSSKLFALKVIISIIKRRNSAFKKTSINL